jgi:hypothetical protein
MSGPDALRLAAFSLAVDRVTAEVTTALDAARIPSVLVKGPAIANWLYAGEGARLYADTDLLVRAADWEGALAVLAGLGFEDDLGPLRHPRMESGAGHPWVRAADGASVDLHRTLFGIGAEPEEVWAAFSTGAVRQRVGGVEVAMPPLSARLLHVCLHAVQDGGDPLTKPMRDLQRAVATVPIETWARAGELAERLRATEAFAAGLRLPPGGREVAEAIGARRAGAAGAALRLEGTPLAEGIQQLAEAPGARAKLALAMREAFPNPAFMRWWTPLARRGHAGLALAYPWRLAWLAYRALPGYRAWRRAARTGTGDSRCRRRWLVVRDSIRKLAWRVSPGLMADRAVRFEAEHHFQRSAGWEVEGGPFAGMRYPPLSGSALRLKRSGQYEEALAARVEALLAPAPPCFVDIGSAEGYYAVGVARRGIETIAYESSSIQRRALRSVAAANGVELEVRRHCRRVPDLPPGSVVMVDAEGAEEDLLSADAARRLATASVVVELHEDLRPRVTEKLCGRFAATHECEVVRGQEEAERTEPPRWGIFTPR